MSVNIERIHSKRVYNDPQLQKRLRFLTNGGWGRHEEGSGMLEWIEGRGLQYVWLLRDSTEAIIAWAAIGRWPYDPESYVGVYVARHARRKGYGTMLAIEAMKFAENLEFTVRYSPWDRKGVALYDKAGYSRSTYMLHRHDSDRW